MNVVELERVHWSVGHDDDDDDLVVCVCDFPRSNVPRTKRAKRTVSLEGLVVWWALNCSRPESGTKKNMGEKFRRYLSRT